MTRLILLPGLASDATMWRAQLAVLPAALRPAVTDVNTRFDSIPHMAQGLLQDHAGELILCGASMGGIVAMEAVRQAPGRIKAMALLGTNARPETGDVRRLRQAAMELFRQGRALEVLQANVPLAFHPDQAADKELAATYLDFVLRAGAQQLVRQNQAIIERPDARAHLPQVRCPVLVMCGDADQLTPPECSREIASLIPHAQLRMVPRCGHMLTMEKPEIVNATLLAWLAALE